MRKKINKKFMKVILLSMLMGAIYGTITFFAIEGARPYGYFTIFLIDILLIVSCISYFSLIFYGSLFFSPLEKFREAFGKSK